ncbi:uncharacterized protein LOC142178311 [Nicotiana tabacum]|uniref:Uncharacterized protein LOC142178311 n=1 Tax=Nicotiana tabacum TaxID=4097 RepID=A0AC58U2N4_TOBAC
MTNPIPTVNNAYSMIIERESQRALTNSSMAGKGTKLTALLAGKGSIYQKQRKNWNLQCNFCKMKGHTKEGCYKIIDYPTDFKNKRNGNMTTTYNAHAENVNPNMTGSSAVGRREFHDVAGIGDLPKAPQLTNEQYSQIMKLLNQDQSVDGSANMADIVHSFLACVEKRNWIIDTGATNHMAADLSMLSKFRAVSQASNKRIHLPNGGITIVLHVGNCKLTDTGEIRNVLYVPDFQYNLLSVSKETRELHCMARFYPDFYIFQDLSSGKVKGIGREKDDLYLLVSQPHTRNGTEEKTVTQRLCAQVEKDVLLWHRRLAHASGNSLKKLFDFNIDECKIALDNCELVAKGPQLPSEDINPPANQAHENFLDTSPIAESDDDGNTLQPALPVDTPLPSDEDILAASNTSPVSNDPPESTAVITAPEPFRRSQRVTKEPIWLSDYITNTRKSNSAIYPISDYLSYDRLSSAHQAYLGVFSSIAEPTSFLEVSKDNRWVDAMRAQIQALQDNHT